MEDKGESGGKYRDVVLDAGDEVCLYGVPVPAEPVHRRSFWILDALSCLHVGIIANNRTKVNDKCKIIAITPTEKVKRPLAGSLPKWYNTDA